MNSRSWFWRGPIQSDQHARAMLLFAAAAFGILAVKDIFDLLAEFTATSAINVCTFLGLALALRILESRVAAACILLFSAFYCCIFAAILPKLAAMGTLPFLWGVLYLSLLGVCTFAGWRAFLAAAFLQRQARGG